MQESGGEVGEINLIILDLISSLTSRGVLQNAHGMRRMSSIIEAIINRAFCKRRANERN